ncbi:hypothetical protein BUE64_12500 [Corynebacterium diphtheriae subsp. lausannense]|uniref:thioesterase domain-containing protein n=1 Tax=Corynebacterium belfantii TaxID=2014537 RepID=UPI0009624EF5|nr:thioesterase domain-containing protein [Corynebacterium belfantii]OLN14555.1 hypothetical protein BUE64_12500 [Corynebacterium diphtheriae subsp. lausannense]MBG9244915.1 hypothetical protein [Corynebacterium belfantii]MBG9311398.1 hypothetical protein [Corynebacterium belfantii]MBG9320452.1 hypothetical protein [Corynebacterium belfantii]MBG9325499.1 hypothetical protein [Corynebacterium belfantii]
MPDHTQSEDRTIFACLPAGSSRNHYRFIWSGVEEGLRVVELPPAREFLPSIDSSLRKTADLIASSTGSSGRATIFGHSLGGSLALAMATFLDQLHGISSQVILSAVPSPNRGVNNPYDASRLINRSIASFLSNESEIPRAFFELIERFVEDDFKAAVHMSEVGFASIDRVVGFISGDDDSLCNADDIDWWRKASPSLKICSFEGGHFGYMDPKIATVYRQFITSFIAG